MQIATERNPARTASLKIEYFLFLLPLALPWLSINLGSIIDSFSLGTWLTPALLLIFVPIVDALIGESKSNPSEAYHPEFSKQPIHRTLPILALPIWMGVFFWGLEFLPSLTLIQWVGWLITLSFVAGICLINVAHELVHRNTQLERIAGGLLLASVWNLTFKIEHVRGHHKQVATAGDHSTAQKGQNIYRFIVGAMLGNISRAWQLETSRLTAQGKSWFQNEMLYFGLFSLTITVLVGLNFGIAGVVFYALLSFLTNGLLEIINFIEHYGLERKSIEGHLEPVNIQHAWNSNFWLSNALLLNLQRHSDHHMNAGRPYTALRHIPESPQLPFGYAAMISIAMIPPLWRRVMDHRISLIEKQRLPLSNGSQ